MSQFQPDTIADLKGLSCPMPMLKTKKALDALEGGKILRVDITDPGSKNDMPALLEKRGDELLDVAEDGGVFTFFIKKKA